MQRFFTPATTNWVKRDAVITDYRTGEEVFRQDGVEVPEFWSQNAVNILAQKYFRGHLGEEGRETSLREVVDRIVDTIAEWGNKDFYFGDEYGRGSLEEREMFSDELKHILVNQYAAFNSPVWFNIGVLGRPQQASACFILQVDDTMESIMDWYRDEAMIFKGGSGAGTNLSNLRGSMEKMSTGGISSGPVSFMRGADASAGAIKSAGATRRAAKMCILNVDHPDIEEFIECKAKEERKARVLRDAGFKMDLGEEDSYSLMYQNANNSVRVTDEFMHAVKEDKDWDLIGRVDGRITGVTKARDLWKKIARAAWECADPGIQFHTTINDWNTTPNSGECVGSNPCLRRGSRIFTSNGWQKIEDLLESDLLIFDGVGFSSGKVWSNGSQPLVRLHVSDGRQIDVTPKHKIYTSEGWISAIESEGCEIPRQTIPGITRFGSNRIPKCVKGASGRYYSVPSVDLMETLGFLQGDGIVRDIYAEVFFTPEKDQKFVESTIVPLLSDISGTEGQSDLSRHGYTFCTNKIVNWLKDMGMCQNRLPERLLPEFVWELPPTSLMAFLRGLFGANGNICNQAANAVRLVSTCEQMLRQVQLLLSSLGIISAVRKHNSAQMIEWSNGVYESKESYHVEITRLDMIEKFRSLINFPQGCQREKLDTINCHYDNGSQLRIRDATITNVEVLSEIDEVFDFSVDSTSMGVANGILLHNCSEHVRLNYSSCNLASINLLKFLDDDGEFDWDGYRHVIEVMFTAMDILVGNCDLPTEKIKETTLEFRDLGLGYTNLGALLMCMGLAYDSDEGRGVARNVTSFLTGNAYKVSADLARRLGPFPAFSWNKKYVLDVIRKHRSYEVDDYDGLWCDLWQEALGDAERYGVRNAQCTVLAPTGTISFLMDADTTGIEPELALVKTKKLATGGTMEIVNQSVGRSLEQIYDERVGPGVIRSIVDYVKEHKTVIGSLLDHEFYPVFATSFGDNAIDYMGHVKMMAAVQPFVSGAISKTVNVPEGITVDEVESLHYQAWEMGLKSIAIYRDNCKVSQPLQTKEDIVEELKLIAVEKATSPVRRKLPRRRDSDTFRFEVGGCEGYVTVGLYDDGTPGEIFMRVSKSGSALAGIMDAFSIAVSIGLQHGVGLEAYVKKYIGYKFEPAGLTDDPDVRVAQSIVDYVFRRLALDYLDTKQRLELGIETTYERMQKLHIDDESELHDVVSGISNGLVSSGKYCPSCGNILQRAGSCDACGSCGWTGGCG